jgi:hypothetical protein
LAWRSQGDRGRESRSSPSLRTVRADLPHTALQSVVLPHRGLTDLSRWVIGHQPDSANEQTPFVSPSRRRIVNMSRFLRNSPRFDRPLPRFPACLAGRHSREGCSVSASVSHPPSCTPFAPSPLRDFLATMGALTPAGHSPTMGQVSLIHVSDLPTPPSPTTPQALDVDFARYPSSRRVSCLRRSRLHHFPAGSPTLTGRIEFVILRMDRSPPAAPHPASRTDAVAVGYRPESVYLKRTSTSPIKHAFRRTGTCAPRAV